VFGVIVLFLAWFFHNKSRSKERALLIEKGASLEDLASMKLDWSKISLKTIAGTVIGFGLGLIVMRFWYDSQNLSQNWFGFPILLGGIGLLITLPRKKSNNSKNSNG
jgi:F0F1-type ATP synthase assembly protein I